MFIRLIVSSQLASRIRQALRQAVFPAEVFLGQPIHLGASARNGRNSKIPTFGHEWIRMLNAHKSFPHFRK